MFGPILQFTGDSKVHLRFDGLEDLKEHPFAANFMLSIVDALGAAGVNFDEDKDFDPKVRESDLTPEEKAKYEESGYTRRKI